MRLSCLPLLVLQAVTSASAVQLSISLPSSHQSALSGSSIGTSAVLHSSPPIRAPLSAAGNFLIDLAGPASEQSAAEGSYLLDVHSKQYVFAPLLVSVGKDGDVKGVWEVRRGEVWGEDGEGMKALEIQGKDQGDIRTVTARIIATRNFYEERQGFSPLSLLKNPMILLAIVALGITFGMPKLLENMDPETRAEFEAAQKQGGISTLMSGGAPSGKSSDQGAPAMNPANFDLAGWMAGQTAKKTEEIKSSGSDIRSGGARRRG